jgi:GTP cyclohydrolase I
MDKKKIIKGVKLLLEGIGDSTRDGIKDTPRRVADMYEEIFSGIAASEKDLLKPIKGESHDEMILIKDIPFYSVCEHHLLPFIGQAHIAYIPSGKIVGLSDLARVLEHFAKRPQVQERLTTQVADFIMKTIKPKGTMVIIDADHLCMSMRGIKKPGSRTVTSAVRGIFRTKPSTREEMLGLIKDIK